jgi:hypothetical protein
MKSRSALALVATALAAGGLAAAPAGASAASSGSGGAKPGPPAPCDWHGLKIVKRVNVGCPLAQKVVASYYGVTYPEFAGWECRNDPPTYGGGHCWKGKKKFKYRAPSR